MNLKRFLKCVPDTGGSKQKKKRLLKYFDCFHIKESANENQQDEAMKPCEFHYISPPQVPDSVVEQGEILNNCEVDYISGLPDSVVHHIYSFLHPRDVASTSVLSKTWNKCWCRYPFAVFNFIDNSNYPRVKDKEYFLDLVERGVHRRIGGDFYLHRFQMYIEFSDLSLLEPYLDRWISIAIGKGVPELTLHVEIVLRYEKRYYSVPRVALQAECLKVLSLSGCTFRSGFDVRLPQLKKFSLYRCKFEDELSFHILMSGCRMVEYVKVSESRSMCKKTLSLMNLPLLKHFESLWNEPIVNVEIYAENLQTFSFLPAFGLWPQRFDLISCTLLKELRLVGEERQSANFAPEHLISQLPSLEVLEFEDFYNGSHDLVIASQMLKKLAFRNCPALHITTADTPNLQSLEICYSDNLFIPINVSTILDVHLILNEKSLELLKRLANFVSTWSSLVHLKGIIYNKSSKRMTIHERMSKFEFDFEFSPGNPSWGQTYICISSKSHTDLMNELIPQVYPEHVYLIHTHDEFVKGTLEKIKNASRNPDSQHNLVGFNVIVDDDSVCNKPMCLHSVLSLHWRERGYVSRGQKVFLQALDIRN